MQERLQNISSELRVDVAVTGILAGLTFSASIALFTYPKRETNVDAVMFLTIIASIVFICATILYATAGGEIRKNLPEDALAIMRGAERMVGVGWILILISFVVIGISVGVFLMVAVIAILFMCLVYMIWVWNKCSPT